MRIGCGKEEEAEEAEWGAEQVEEKAEEAEEGTEEVEEEVV